MRENYIHFLYVCGDIIKKPFVSFFFFFIIINNFLLSIRRPLHQTLFSDSDTLLFLTVFETLCSVQCPCISHSP